MDAVSWPKLMNTEYVAFLPQQTGKYTYINVRRLSTTTCMRVQKNYIILSFPYSLHLYFLFFFVSLRMSLVRSLDLSSVIIRKGILIFYMYFRIETSYFLFKKQFRYSLPPTPCFYGENSTVK